MLISFLRAVILYLVLVLSIRLLGKRQIGEMAPAELVVAMLLANIASIPMQDSAIPLLSGLVPILTVLGLELLLSVLTMLSIRWRKLLSGKPVILISEGRILPENLRKTRLNLDELTEQLRQKDIFDLSTVKYAILETSGELSTLLYAKAMPPTARDAGIAASEEELPYTIISNGKLIRDNLRLCRRDERWVKAELAARQLRMAQVVLLTVDKNGKLYLSEQEDGS